jgi:urea transport system substrate-binding protein
MKKYFIILLILSVCVIFSLFYKSNEVIRVGILHSQSGTMAIAESPIVDILKFGIDEINNNGGVLGRKIVPIIYDAKSDIDEFKKGAEYLLGTKKVEVIFGCWTSASRKSIKPIIERYNKILFYPVQYEGIESSKNIIYNSLVANQQLIPAINFAIKNFIGNRFYILGSDYIYPRVANHILSLYSSVLNARVLKESYVKLGEKDFSEVIKEIELLQPDIIFNNINGDSNNYFYKALKEANIADIPILSFSLTELEIETIEEFYSFKNYISTSYFYDLNKTENKDFKTKVNMKLTAPMVNAYSNLYLYVNAINMANSTNSDDILKFLKGSILKSPAGFLYIDHINNHAWRENYIVKFEKNKKEVVFSSETPIRPEPYLGIKSEFYWNRFLDNLYFDWNRSWQAN